MTLKHVVQMLRERAAAVETYGAGGCPTCHDAELRGAIAVLEGLAARSGQSASPSPSAGWDRSEG